ncbi:hypothetical protein D3C86_1916650 [compost metagenome]
MAFVIFKPALTAAAKMFNQRAVGGGFPPESIGETASWTKYLHRNVTAFAFWRTYLGRIEIVRIPGVIQNQAVGLAGSQP